MITPDSTAGDCPELWILPGRLYSRSQLPAFALMKKKGVSLQADVMSCRRSPWELRLAIPRGAAAGD